MSRGLRKTPKITKRAETARGSFLFRGKKVFLYGGELQYFRVRAKENDERETKRTWAETLDMMKAAGMNYVSSYVPWDYHCEREDEFDFSGQKDLDFFLSLCVEKGFFVHIKPGPYINAEWPTGFGSFGAVPDWLKQRPDVHLVTDRDGRPYYFAFHGVSAADERQPTYLCPVFLDHVKKWYEQVVRIAAPYMKHPKSGIVMLQIDNETNFFFEERYRIDYSKPSINHYHGYLEAKYGTIAALSDAYELHDEWPARGRGRSHSSFDEVTPPTSKLNRDDDACAGVNRWHWDWFDAGAQYVHEYHARLKEMLVELLAREGVSDSDVIFTFNDSTATFFDRQILLYDGPRRKRLGLSTLDCYPKTNPFRDALHDHPFEADYFAKLFDYYNNHDRKQRFVFGAEVQGGWFSYLPNLFPGTFLEDAIIDATIAKPLMPNVKPQATDQLLAKLIGHGLKGVGVYIIREGYNVNNDLHEWQSALNRRGRPRRRFRVLEDYGKKLIGPYGLDLLASEEVEHPIAVAANWQTMYPQRGAHLDAISLFTEDNAGLFGMLMSAGRNPQVIDLNIAAASAMAKLAAIFYINAGFLDRKDAEKIVNYVAQGGTFINFHLEGKYDLEWREDGEANRMLANELFPGKAERAHWPHTHGDVAFEFFGAKKEIHHDNCLFVSAPPPACTPFLFKETAFADRRVVGYFTEFGKGRAYFIGTTVSRRFNQPDYYRLSREELEATTGLVEFLLRDAVGVEKIISAKQPFVEVWARRRRRRASGGAFVFVVNGRGYRRVNLEFHDLSPLGLTPDGLCEVKDIWRDESKTLTVESLQSEGLELTGVKKHGTVLLRLSELR